MGLFDIFKRNEVPAELPSLSSVDSSPKLVSDHINKTGLSSINFDKIEKEDNLKYKKLPVQKIEKWNSVKETNQENKEQNSLENEKSFFKELISDLTNEITGEKLDSKYKDRILEDDIVSQMKMYWEKQKPEVFLQNAGREIKEQLIKKAENLTMLEKDWQNAYFSLVAKEEKIRQEEKELKKMVSELIGIYEKSLEKRYSREDKKKN